MQNKFQALHILIIDDDDRIRELLARFLSKEMILVNSAANTDEARQYLSYFVFDMIITDLMMPNETGAELTAWLRKERNEVPMIMLTAASHKDAMIESLNSGIDDYIAKPFDPEELMIRIKNLMVRSGKTLRTSPLTKIKKQEIKLGDYCYKNNELYCNDQLVLLTEAENKVLAMLVAAGDSGMSRGDIALALNIEERSIDVQINRLRKKIHHNNFLRSIRNYGYRIVHD